MIVIYKKLLKIVNYIVEKGTEPFEEALEIDLNDPKVKAEMNQLSLKTAGSSFLARVRKELKRHDTKNIRRKKP